MPVIAQIAKKIDQAGAIFFVSVPEILYALSRGDCLFDGIISHVEAGRPDGITAKELWIH
ncbi:MAG: hypothetical protein ACLR23_15985 [Clostridia bacterium]